MVPSSSDAKPAIAAGQTVTTDATVALVPRSPIRQTDPVQASDPVNQSTSASTPTPSTQAAPVTPGVKADILLASPDGTLVQAEPSTQDAAAAKSVAMPPVHEPLLPADQVQQTASPMPSATDRPLAPAPAMAAEPVMPAATKTSGSEPLADSSKTAAPGSAPAEPSETSDPKTIDPKPIFRATPAASSPTLLASPADARHAPDAANALGIHAVTHVTPENAVNAETGNRNTAMERPTMTSPDSRTVQIQALSAVSRPALEEGTADTAPDSQSHDSGEQSARSTTSSDAARAGAVTSTTSSFSRQLEVETSGQPLDVEERLRTAEIVEQVRRKIDAMQLTRGKQEVTLRLHPEHLGEVRLTIVTDRAQVVARFMAETAQARQAMTDGREQLRAALEQKGFTLQSLDVDRLDASSQSAIGSGQWNGFASANGGERFMDRSRMNQTHGNGTVRSEVRASEIDTGASRLLPESGPRRRLDQHA